MSYKSFYFWSVCCIIVTYSHPTERTFGSLLFKVAEKQVLQDHFSQYYFKGTEFQKSLCEATLQSGKQNDLSHPTPCKLILAFSKSLQMWARILCRGTESEERPLSLPLLFTALLTSLCEAANLDAKNGMSHRGPTTSTPLSGWTLTSASYYRLAELWAAGTTKIYMRVDTHRVSMNKLLECTQVQDMSGRRAERC